MIGFMKYSLSESVDLSAGRNKRRSGARVCAEGAVSYAAWGTGPRAFEGIMSER